VPAKVGDLARSAPRARGRDEAGKRSPLSPTFQSRGASELERKMRCAAAMTGFFELLCARRESQTIRQLPPIPFSLWRIPEPAGAGAGAVGGDGAGRAELRYGDVADRWPPPQPRQGRPVDHDRYPRARARPAAAAATEFRIRLELEDGPRATGASGRGGDLRRRRPTGSRRDRRGVAHSGWGAAAAAATAVADSFLRLAGSGWTRGWTSGCRARLSNSALNSPEAILLFRRIKGSLRGGLVKMRKDN
jgi:hypothetical protein